MVEYYVIYQSIIRKFSSQNKTKKIRKRKYTYQREPNKKVQNQDLNNEIHTKILVLALFHNVPK